MVQLKRTLTKIKIPFSSVYPPRGIGDGLEMSFLFNPYLEQIDKSILSDLWSSLSKVSN